MEFDVEFIVAQAKIVTASFMGSVIRLYIKPMATFGKSVFTIFCCLICGYYFTPVIMDVTGFSESWTGAVGAMIGLLGLTFAEALMNLDWQDLCRRFLESWTPKKK